MSKQKNKSYDAKLSEKYVNRLATLLFTQGSTNQMDYTTPIMDNTPKQVVLPVIEKKHQKPFHRKDTHTMTEYQSNVPFDLGWMPKPIVRTNPKDIVPVIESIEDHEGKERARRTRPRLIMTPAFALDDIDNEEVRNVIMKEIYSSNYMVANESVATQRGSVVAPLPKIYGHTRPITLPECHQYKVEREWRRQTVKFESDQLRTPCTADQKFWNDYDITKTCVACLQTAQVQKMRKMKKNIS